MHQLFIFLNILYTVKPVLRGHLWNNEKWRYKTGDLLKEVQFIYMKFSIIEVTSWAVLTVLFFYLQ